MARGTAPPQQPATFEHAHDFDPAEIMLLPMHVVTYRALADAALRDGIPLVEFMQRMFERAVRDGVRKP